MYLDINSKAIDFTLKNKNGEDIKLSDYRGRKVILYFYPKDNTPGCSKEACGFNENLDAFASKNAVIIGVSKDTVASHLKFSSKYNLQFEILADPDLEVLKAYGVWQMKKSYGKEYMGTVRTTYVISEEGIIEKVYKVTRVNNHVEKVLEEI